MLACAVLVGPARAHAATPTEADKLFEEGRVLLNKGKGLTVRTKKWIDGMTIQRDDTSLGADALGVPLPVDPGEHTVVARAPKHKKWETSVKVGGDADKQSVDIFLAAPSGDDEEAAPAAGEPAVPASEAETALRLRLTGAPMFGAAGLVLEGRFR